MSLSTYKKRGGTSDRGKDYEWLLCAFYSLTFSTTSEVTDFELFANNEFFGDFDDVTLRVRFSNGTIKVFLLQLKHSEKSKHLALASLTAPSGDFTLHKYKKSHDNIINLGNFHFILYVNKSANFKDGTKLRLGSEEVVIRQHRCVGNGLLNTNRSRQCSVFTFATDSNQEFFSNFFLYVNQQNDTGLKQSISDLLKAKLKSDVYTSFVEFMRGWWAGNFKLTKHDVVAKLAELVLSPMIRTLTNEESNNKTKLIEEAILQFDMTMVKTDKISKIWSKFDSNMKQVSLTCLKFGLTTKGIGRMEELSIEKKSKVLWFMDERPLLVEADESRKEQIDSVVFLLGRCKPKRIILIGYCGAAFQNWKILRNLSDISVGLRQRITQALTCSLQGKNKITLEDLGAHSSKLCEVFGVDHLLSIASNDCNLAESLAPLPPTYIPRSFHKILFNYSVIDGLANSKILLSCNGHKELALTKFNKRAVDITHFQKGKNFFKYHIFVSEEEFTPEQVTKEFSCSTTSHHFRVVDGQNLQWLSSNLKIEELEDYKRVNPNLIFEERDIDDHVRSKVKILTSHTGTGKTSFLSRVKNQAAANWFVLKMNLKEHSEFFGSCKTPIWDYIVDFTANTQKYDNFELELLRNFDKEKVLLLWDGLDELAVNSIDGFLVSVDQLQSMGLTQWIASQNRFQKLLERRFKGFALTLVPFREEEQIDYIQNRCGVSTDIMKLFFENMKIIDNQEYLGVPLQLYILTEIFSKDPKLLERIYTLTDMFSAFIEGRYNHFLSRNRSLNELQNLGSLIKDAKNYRLEQYKIAALKTHIPELSLELKLTNNQKFLDDLKEGDFLGIIEKVDQCLVFEHQIFGEFLSASFLAENLPSGIDKFLFEEKFRNVRLMFDLLLADSNPTFIAILYKKFADIRSEQVRDKGGRNPLHLICSYGQRHPTWRKQDEDTFVEEDSKDLTRCVKRLAKTYDPFEKDGLFQWTCFDYADRSCSFGLLDSLEGVKRVLPDLYNYNFIVYYSVRMNYSNVFTASEDVPFVEDPNGDNLIHIATQFDRDKCLTRILSQKIFLKGINRANKDKWTPLHIATFNGNLPFVKLLMKSGATIMLREPSLMSLAVSKGRKDLVELFLSSGCSPNELYHSNLFTTSIFQAVQLKHDSIVELLLQNGAKLYCLSKSLSDGKPNAFGMNVFHMLLENEKFEEAEAVLTKGIHVDSVDNRKRTALHHAASNNQERVARFLLAKGASLEVLDKNMRSPLHCATHNGSLEVAAILINKGVDLDAKDEEEMTPLHFGVLSGNANCVTYLLKQGVDPNVGNKYKRTPMHIAAQYDLSQCIDVLHEHGGDLEARESLYGRTPLQFAAWHGSDLCVEVFLKKEVPVDSCCNFGFTSLHLAVEDAHMKCCQILLEAGASVRAVNRNGSTPLGLIKKGYMALARLLMDYDPQPLHSAVSRNDINFINELLTLDFDVNGVDDVGNTPLHVAANCHEPILLVQTLLKKGADLKKQNSYGFTPLHYALRSEFPDERVIKLLTDPESVNGRTSKGITPLHLAAESVTLEGVGVVEFLLEKGAKSVSDDEGLIPLHYASCSGNVEIVALLRTDCDKITKRGRTALHMAATGGHLKVVQLLLQNHASVDVKDFYGDTPLDDALKAEQPEVFEALLGANPEFDVCTTNRKGRTILHMAAKKGLLDLVELFSDAVPVDVVDHDGTTALEEALFNRHYSVFSFLLEKASFDVNKFSRRYRRYPLHVVTCTGSFLLVDLFLKRGARVDVLDDDGNTPLHNSVHYYHPGVFNKLLEYAKGALDVTNKKGQTILHLAVESNKTKIVNDLVSKGANLELSDCNGNTPFDLLLHRGTLLSTDVLSKIKNFNVNKMTKLKETLLHLAVDDESVETIEWLVQRGASINSEDVKGETALHCAARQKPKVLNLLLKKFRNVDLEKKNKKGETALHIAAAHSSENVELLLKMGASPYATTKNGDIPLFYALKVPKRFKLLWLKTPEIKSFQLAGHETRTVLHEAASEGDLDSVNFLLDLGLKMNEVDDKGNTPLSDAVLHQHLEVLRRFLQRDTKHVVVNVCYKHGQSLLHFAARAGNFHLVKLLVANGARTDLYDEDGCSAADCASERKHTKIAQFLKDHEKRN